MGGNGPRELLFVETGSDTAGQRLTMEALYPPRTSYPPAHFHPEQDERFTVLAGALTVRLDGVERRYRPGETVQIPRGVAHTMHNAEPDETRVRWEVMPALRTAGFFAAMAAEQPGTGKFARLTRLATIMREHRREIALTKPPLVVQRTLFGLLSTFDRRAGRERYDQAGADLHV